MTLGVQRMCTGVVVTVFSSCVLGVHLLSILVVYWGTVTVYSSCVLG